MSKADLIYLAKIQSKFDEDMNSCFSDNEENALASKARAITNAIEMELNELKAKHLLKQREKLQQQFTKEGKQTKGLWMSDKGPMRIEDLENNHLARIPSFLLKNKRVHCIEEIPSFIVEEIKERGWILKPSGYVQQR